MGQYFINLNLNVLL